LLPLVLKWAAESRIPLLDALAKVTSAPAQILAEPTGRLAVGAKADICIFDPDEPWRPEPAALVSYGKNTPFSAYELVGRARFTLVGGDVRFTRR
jgi:dihydroorotase